MNQLLPIVRRKRRPLVEAEANIQHSTLNAQHSSEPGHGPDATTKLAAVADAPLQETQHDDKRKTARTKG